MSASTSGDEITVASIEKRFDPLWHAVAHKRLVYDRGRKYRVPWPTRRCAA
jgi:hypothetical protein